MKHGIRCLVVQKGLESGDKRLQAQKELGVATG